MSDVSTDVLIVGGGPVGLAMAIALRSLGVESLVIERHHNVSEFPRGRLVRTRTMELVRRWGLEDAVTAAALPPEQVAMFVGDSLLADDFRRVVLPDLGGSDLSPSRTVMCEQSAFELVLRTALRDRGIAARFGAMCTVVAHDARGVRAAVTDRATGRQNAVSARFLVAADGANGSIREQLGIGQHGPGVLGQAVSVLFDAPLGQRMIGRASGRYDITGLPGGTVLCVDNDRRWILVYGFDPDVEPPESFHEARLLELVRQAIGDDRVVPTVRDYSFWASTALVSNQFGHDSVFLVGDAAHVTTPVGGLGMNCGVGDVDNLAWKLAAVLQGWADERLLDTYETERKPIAELTVEASLGRARPPATMEGLVLGAVYDSPGIVPDGSEPPMLDDPFEQYEPHARPGRRAPHAWIGHDRSTLDLFGSGFVLLTGRDNRLWMRSAAAVTGIPLQCHNIGGTCLTDYGIGDAGAVLVRPDGHVTFRSTTAAMDDETLRHAVDRAVGRYS